MSQRKYIFGYGSLVSRKSIKHTIGRDPGKLCIVELNGWVRDWGVVLDNLATIRRFELQPSRETPHYVAALNIRKPKENESPTNPNGVLFEVTDEDIAKMDNREDHYIRVDITTDIAEVAGFDERIYAYVGKEEFYAKENDKRNIILPGSYLKLVESNFDKEGLKKFRETTISAPYPVLDTVHSSGV